MRPYEWGPRLLGPKRAQVKAEVPFPNSRVMHLGRTTMKLDVTPALGTVEFDDRDLSKLTSTATMDVAFVDTRIETEAVRPSTAL